MRPSEESKNILYKMEKDVSHNGVMVLFHGPQAYLFSLDKDPCYFFSTTNNYCEFLSSYNVLHKAFINQNNIALKNFL